MPLTLLVLGGARSGKSAYAQERIESLGLPCIYIATGEARDAEMRARIALHRSARGARWRSVEEPVELPRLLADGRHHGSAVLIDCLTLWLSNLMERGLNVEYYSSDLAEAVRVAATPLALVSNEIGLGIVPDNAAARAFRDHAGRLHQKLAAVCREVVFTVAGLPMQVKGGV